MPALLQQLAPLLTPAMLITDVGSAKQCVIDAARKSLGSGIRALVPGHPIAGTEKSGPRNAVAELFTGRMAILTPLPENDAVAVARIRALWETAGATVQLLDPAHHDRVLAATSHLPHMVAYALVDCLARMDEREEIFRFAAGGLADFTRIASSSPEMWHDVCAANRDQLLAAMDRFEEHLRRIRVAVEQRDSGELLTIFRRAKAARDRLASRRRPASE
jgi:prephenate dehydrogenase